MLLHPRLNSCAIKGVHNKYKQANLNKIFKKLEKKWLGNSHLNQTHMLALIKDTKKTTPKLWFYSTIISDVGKLFSPPSINATKFAII